VELGALVLTQGDDLNGSSGGTANFWSSSWPVVGKTVLQRWIERIRDLGVGMVSVVNRDAQPPARMLDWAKEGVDRILLIVSGSYAEIDFSDLIHFHQQEKKRITRVFDKFGPLGISLLDRGAVLRQEGRKGEGLHSSRYDFQGYVSRLSSTMAYRQLVQDALEGRCGIQPAGLQADERVWIDPSAYVDPSAKLQGPCYVGANTRLNAGVVVTGYSSVERNCEIDIGTSLDHACVLPNTYLAPGLHVKNSVVDGARLEHLDHGVTVDLQLTGLASRRWPSTPVAFAEGIDKALIREKNVRQGHSFLPEDPDHDV
jgi:hypothetical protein